jgi:hypothetical protein
MTAVVDGTKMLTSPAAREIPRPSRLEEQLAPGGEEKGAPDEPLAARRIN